MLLNLWYTAWVESGKAAVVPERGVGAVKQN